MAGVVLFFALTRTEVGREGLRLEIERQFAERFDGEIEIGHLSGDLLNRLSAGDVQIRDSSGRIVFEIDSIIAHPSWRDLMRRTVTTGRVTLIRPEVHLTRDADGSWNVASVFRGGERLPDALPWSFHSADVTIVDGRVVTHSIGTLPLLVREGTTFNFADAEVLGLDGRAIVDWTSDLKLIDVLELSGRIPDINLPIDSLRGQIVARNGGIAVNELYIRLGGTRLQLAGSLSSYAALREHPSDAIVEVDLRSSTLRAEELSRIFPKLPFSDEVAASLRAQGPLSSLAIEDLRIGRGRSAVSAEGTLLGLPDSLDYELAFRPSSLTWSDMDAVVPGAALPNFDHLGTVQFSGYSDGVMRFADTSSRPFWQATSEMQTSSDAGQLNADLNIAVGGDPHLAVEGFIRSRDFNLGMVIQRDEWSSVLNGEARIRGKGPTLMESTGDVTISLSPSQFAGRSIDTLRFDGIGEDGRLQGRLRADQSGGNLLARLQLDTKPQAPTYTIDGTLSRFDVGSVFLSDSIHTSLNLQFGFAGRGNSPGDFQGRLDLSFDESHVTYEHRERTVPAHRTSITVRQDGAASPVLDVTGDVLSLRVTGDVAVEPLISLSNHWIDAFRRSLERTLGTPLHGHSLARIEKEEEPTDESLYLVHDLDRPDIRRQALDASMEVKRADILTALLPMLPDVRTDLAANVALSFDRDQFALDVSATADTFDTDRVVGRDLTLTIETRGSLVELAAHVLDARFDVSAARMLVGEQEFVSPTAGAVFNEHGIDIDVASVVSGAAAPLRFAGRLDQLSDRVRMDIKTLQLAVKDQVWQADSTHAIDIYRDAVVATDLSIRRTDPHSAGTERLRLRGTLSSAPSDSLAIDVRELPLRDVMELLAVDRPLSGTVNGQLTYTGFRRQPELTGSIFIDQLSYDNRVLGALQIDSRYIPGSPDVGLDLRILPLELPESDPRRYEANDLALTGTFRLPGVDAAGLRHEGALDLDIEAAQLNAFFLEYIFQNKVSDVQGIFAGSGSIGGTLARPLFYASLELDEGRFRVPEFNLEYGASGEISVDELGIHVDDVVLTDAGGGSAAVKGSILFNEYRFFSFDLHGRLDEMQIMNVSQSRELPFFGRIAASGDMSLTGPLSRSMLRSANAVTTEDSDLFIPITESDEVTDAGFIVFADSVGRVPDIRRLTTRDNLLAERPAGERPFLEGLEMDLNITAPVGSTVHLVIDPLLGDVINAVGEGRVQLLRTEGEFFTYGRFDVDSGDYLFTAGEVFFRRFLIDEGSISWDGDPLNATLDIDASYRTRASTEGLTDACGSTLIPLVIRMNVLGRVATPSVELALAIDRDNRRLLAGCAQGLEAELNEPELTAQYATSVLLTNSFLLTTSSIGSEQSQGLSDTRNQLAFNSLSQLVASQLNRYLNYALPNLDVNLGILGESAQDLDVTYGVALRLLDERLIIRGQGIVQNEPTESRQQSGLDEFVVEIRLNSSVSVEVFYRREGLLQTAETLSTNTTGAGVSYQTQFATWRRFVHRLFGWMLPEDEEEADPNENVVAGGGDS